MFAWYSSAVSPLDSSKGMRSDRPVIVRIGTRGHVNPGHGRRMDRSAIANSNHLPRFAGCTPADLYSTSAGCITVVMPSHDDAGAVQVAASDRWSVTSQTPGPTKDVPSWSNSTHNFPTTSRGGDHKRRPDLQPFTNGAQPVSTGVPVSGACWHLWRNGFRTQDTPSYGYVMQVFHSDITPSADVPRP